jgi:hypothetical protein
VPAPASPQHNGLRSLRRRVLGVRPDPFVCLINELAVDDICESFRVDPVDGCAWLASVLASAAGDEDIELDALPPSVRRHGRSVRQVRRATRLALVGSLAASRAQYAGGRDVERYAVN